MLDKLVSAAVPIARTSLATLQDSYVFCRTPIPCTSVDSEPTWFAREIPYSYEMLAENLADPSHTPHSHHNVIGALFSIVCLQTPLCVLVTFGSSGAGRSAQVTRRPSWLENACAACTTRRSA